MQTPTASLVAKIFGCLAIACSLSLAPGVAKAGDKALAEALFQEGRKLLDAGNLDAACAKFDASQRQDPSPGTLINLGKCNEARGRTATAWANYKEAESLARNMSRSEQEATATERVAALEPRLSRLEIKPPKTAVEGLAVKRGGNVMSADALGISSPADPGDYEIEASAPGYKTWKGKVTVGKEKDNATIQIPDLEKSAEPVAAPVPAPVPAGQGQKESKGEAKAQLDTDKGGGSTKTIGYVLTGVGAVALIAGSYFGYAASKQASDAQDDPELCPDKKCTSKGWDEIDSAESKALISTIGVGVGVAALGTGIVLLVTAPSSKEQAKAARSRRAQFSPYLDGRNAGFFLSGAF